MDRDMTRRTVMMLRQKMPSFLRSLLRIIRLLTVKPVPPVQVPPHLLNGCILVASRFELVSHLGSGAIVEVGTQSGNFARHILDVAEPQSLDVIDLDLSRLRPDVRAHPSVRAHQGNSSDVLRKMPDAAFDWIYVDADHSFNGVKRDAEAAMRKVKPGGFLVFNDFAHADPFIGRYGVHSAVADFMVRYHWPMKFMAYEINGLYDVALQRPE